MWINGDSIAEYSPKKQVTGRLIPVENTPFDFRDMHQIGNHIDDENDLLMERDSLYAIHEKLHQYGFILRYPARTEEITGHDFEPWHFRYIGDLDAAFAIYDDDLTLEEYLGENPAE